MMVREGVPSLPTACTTFVHMGTIEAGAGNTSQAPPKGCYEGKGRMYPPYPRPVQPSPTWGRLKPAQSLPGISHLHCIPPRQCHASPSPFPNHQYSTATRRHLIHQYSTATLRRHAAIRPPFSQLPPPQPISCIPFSITSTIVLPFQLHLS